MTLNCSTVKSSAIAPPVISVGPAKKVVAVTNPVKYPSPSTNKSPPV